MYLLANSYLLSSLSIGDTHLIPLSSTGFLCHEDQTNSF